MPFSVTFSLDTPETNYNVRIETVLVVAGELWVLSQVGTDADLGGCMISVRWLYDLWVASAFLSFL